MQGFLRIFTFPLILFIITISIIIIINMFFQTEVIVLIY